MLEISPKTNLLEQKNYRYTLQDVAEPNLYRDIYDYESVPKIPFNHRRVPMNMPEEIWITDTSFRDGQQSVDPYTPDQIVELYKLMSKLGGPYGIIRQTEFFIYSQKDREALERCRDLGLRFPEITTWIRATKEDFRLVRDLGIRETGILVSCSDYHIFKKMKLTRAQAMKKYLETVAEAFEAGVMPRCHLEDITRADFYGFVVPFVNELMKMSRDAGIPVRIRACDTMGYGVPYSEVALPRSVPGIVYGLQHYSDVSSDMLEWHGHNDFYKAVSNAATAWLYGACAVNCSLLGIGERTGNIPLEAMVFEYASLRGSLDGMDPTVITEIADYFKNEIGYEVPPMTPFVGRYFNMTRAGIHADGLLKEEEIYNIFNTRKLLNRPAGVMVSKTSGLAGIAYWINENYGLTGENAVQKHDPLVQNLKAWVDEMYEGGRTTSLSPHELERKVEELNGGPQAGREVSAWNTRPSPSPIRYLKFSKKTYSPASTRAARIDRNEAQRKTRRQPHAHPRGPAPPGAGAAGGGHLPRHARGGFGYERYRGYLRDPLPRGGARRPPRRRARQAGADCRTQARARHAGVLHHEGGRRQHHRRRQPLPRYALPLERQPRALRYARAAAPQDRALSQGLHRPRRPRQRVLCRAQGHLRSRGRPRPG